MNDASDKNSDMFPGWLPVVAGALMGPEERWLMHRRPAHKHHGGLWEFPGGKVETSEIPIETLVRELHEELGIVIRPEDCEPFAFAEERTGSGARPIVILLYRIARYEGNPLALEGGEVAWFTAAEIAALDKPPLDIELSARLFANG